MGSIRIPNPRDLTLILTLTLTLNNPNPYPNPNYNPNPNPNLNPNPKVTPTGGYSNYFLTGRAARGLKPLPISKDFSPSKNGWFKAFLSKFAQIGTHF